MISVASQFRKSWRHETECPKVRAIYKIVSTMENLAKYERYLSVLLIGAQSSPWLTAAIAIKLKPKVNLLRKASLPETKTADGTGPRGNAISEIKEWRRSALTLRVPCVVSSSHRSICAFSPRIRIGGGSEWGSILLRLHQSLCPFSASVLELPSNNFGWVS